MYAYDSNSKFTHDNKKKNLCLLTDPSLFMDTLGSFGTQTFFFFIRHRFLLLLSIFFTWRAGNVKEKQIMHVNYLVLLVFPDAPEGVI